MPALHRRLAVEDGLGLVEMIIAVFILTVALFALLGSMIAVAQSTQEQRMRTSATRIANTTIETLRAVGFDELEDVAETSEVVPTPDGRQFTVTREITTVPALPEATEGEDVKQIRVVVSWTSRGITKSVPYTTVVAPLERPATLAGRITAETFPNPADVYRDDDVRHGFTTAPVRIVAVFNFEFDGNPRVVWTDKSGTLKEMWLSPPQDELDSVVWDGEFDNTCVSPTDQSCIYYPIDPDDDEDPRQLAVTVTGGGVSTLATLRLQPLSDLAPAFASPTTITNPINVSVPPGGSQCKGAQQCTNTHAVNVVATVTGVNPDGRVVLRYQTRNDGAVAFEEAALVRSEVDPNRWTHTFPTSSTKFRPNGADGSHRTFDFIATHTVGEGEEAHEVSRVHQLVISVQES